MVMGKRVKTGGSYYKGYKTAVASASAGYPIVIALTTSAALAAVSFTPDMYGAGDNMTLKKYDDALGAGNVTKVIADSLYNIGANASIQMDFPALMLCDSGECFVANYVNTASVAGNFYVIAEFVGINKTA